MGVQIIPTVLANSLDEFNVRLKRLLPIADVLQIDIMDGRFVPSTSVAINYLPDMKQWPKKLFEAHLMVQTPGAFIQPLARRGFKRVIFHIETVDAKTAQALLGQCSKYKVAPVIAINPETPIERVLPYVEQVEAILFLGVHPGFNGAPFVPTTPQKIRSLLRKAPKLLVQVDGGMTPASIGLVVEAGARRINSGSYVSNAKDPKQALQLLQRTADAALPKISATKVKPAKTIPTTRKSVKRSR